MKNPITLIKGKIVRHIESKYKKQFVDSKTIWSQYGEDIVISWLFLHKSNGFYVDIGAYHPKKLSNTNWFYERGWRGINIDPNLDSIELFNEQRPEDINLGVGVHSTPGELNFYKFEEPNLNTLNREVAEEHIANKIQLINKAPVPVKRLDAIFDEHAKGRKIDFITIDAEGVDMEVLESNDWEKYYPTVVCIEDWTMDIELYLRESKKHKFLKSKGYKLVSKVVDSYIYSSKHNRSLNDIK